MKGFSLAEEREALKVGTRFSDIPFVCVLFISLVDLWR